MTTKQVVFPLGNVYMTPGISMASDAFKKEAASCFTRHSKGDWGTLDKHDWEMNQEALVNGGRILSNYEMDCEEDDPDRLWIITEAEDENGSRAATTLLLPSEY